MLRVSDIFTDRRGPVEPGSGAHVGVIAPYRYLDGGSGGNFVLVASQSPVARDGVQAGLNERSLNEIAWFGDQARDFADGAPVLRDDYAPVDQLIGRP